MAITTADLEIARTILAQDGFDEKHSGLNEPGSIARLSAALRLLIQKADVPADVEEYCDECGGVYPKDAKSEEGPWHSLSCSLHESE